MTQEYELWFRDVGQFLPPCDGLHDAEKLEPFKRFGWECWREAVQPAKSDHAALKDGIETVLAEEDNDEAALNRIGKLVNA